MIDNKDYSDTSTTPHTITMYKDKIATYISGNKAMYRYFWDPQTKKLSQDTSWVISDYLKPGQTAWRLMPSRLS